MIAKAQKQASRRRIRNRRFNRQWKQWQRDMADFRRRVFEEAHDPVGQALEHYAATRPFREVVSRRLH